MGFRTWHAVGHMGSAMTTYHCSTYHQGFYKTMLTLVTPIALSPFME